MSFVAQFDDYQVNDTCSYRIEERKGTKVVRTFTGKVRGSQRASAKGWNQNSDALKVKRWCELFPMRLPKNGGSVDMDLDEVAKD